MPSDAIDVRRGSQRNSYRSGIRAARGWVRRRIVTLCAAAQSVALPRRPPVIEASGAEASPPPPPLIEAYWRHWNRSSHRWGGSIYCRWINLVFWGSSAHVDGG